MEDSHYMRHVTRLSRLDSHGTRHPFVSKDNGRCLARNDAVPIDPHRDAVHDASSERTALQRALRFALRSHVLRHGVQ